LEAELLATSGEIPMRMPAMISLDLGHLLTARIGDRQQMIAVPQKPPKNHRSALRRAIKTGRC
jgi:hypothetical protein